MISATLKNGSLVSGLLVKETKNEIILRLPATAARFTHTNLGFGRRIRPRARHVPAGNAQYDHDDQDRDRRKERHPRPAAGPAEPALSGEALR